MKIGIVSDSHGGAELLQAALDNLVSRGAEAIVHCGDIGSEKCMTLLGSTPLDTYAVAGNMDRHILSLAKVAQKAGVVFHDQVIEVPLPGPDKQYLVATHGHDDAILNELILDEQFPYVCHGHTHRIRDERIGPVHVICPGALYHPRNPRHPTTVLLDTIEDTVTFIEL